MSLPPSWRTLTLAEVAEVIQGQSPPGASYNTSGVGVPLFQGKAEFGPVNPTPRKWTTAPTRMAKKGDILLSVRAPVGATNLAPIDCAIGRDLAALRAHEGIDTMYLFYAIRGTIQVLLRHAVGTTITGVTGKQVRNHAVPIPPFAEQQRIVAVIEEQFSRLDAAVSSLERVRRNLDLHRYATLFSAVSGSWETRPLVDLLISLRNGVFVSRPAHEPPGTPIFRISAVRPMSLDAEDVRFAPSDTDQAGAYVVQEGDLLFTRYSGNASYVGACARVPRLPRPTLHPDKLIRAVVDQSVADPTYLELALSVGPSQLEIAKRRKTTAGQIGIAGSQLKTVPVALPPLEIQRRIVKELDGPRSLWSALSRDLLGAPAKVGRLRSAILREAFAGRLAGTEVRDESRPVLRTKVNS